MNKQLKKLAEKIEKYYYSHNQMLLIDTWEVMTNDEQDCSFDIYLAGTDIGLFEVLNYNGYADLERMQPKSYFKDNKHEIKYIVDIIHASSQPLYMNRRFTLKTFKPITKDDIINCVNYFIHEVLHLYLFNMQFNEEIELTEKQINKKILIEGLNKGVDYERRIKTNDRCKI